MPRVPKLELPQDEPELDERKVGELTIEELMEAMARVQARKSA